MREGEGQERECACEGGEGGREGGGSEAVPTSHQPSCAFLSTTSRISPILMVSSSSCSEL